MSLLRYYPEGGWGWCVLACACLARALAHGLQLSFAFPLAWRVARRFLRAASPKAANGDDDDDAMAAAAEAVPSFPEDRDQESLLLGESMSVSCVLM